MATSRKRTTSKSKRAIGIKHGFRSGLEQRVSTDLQNLDVTFEYEKHVYNYVRPAKRCRYTPDFVITHRPDGSKKDKPLIVETKGRFLTADRQKHLLFKDQHPDEDLRFVFSNPQQKISKQSKTTYAMWCEKHGFLYAKEKIPEEWLWE